MAQIESIQALLKGYEGKKRRVEIKTVSGKIYQGQMVAVVGEYFSLKEYLNTYISIDKIESIIEE